MIDLETREEVTQLLLDRVYDLADAPPERWRLEKLSDADFAREAVPFLFERVEEHFTAIIRLGQLGGACGREMSEDSE